MRAGPLCFFILLTAGAGCLEVVEPSAPRCSECHGSELSPAPPAALGGISDPDFVGVGAHERHLEPARAVPVACSECHLVPGSLDDEGHIDTPWPAEVQWGPLATTGGASDPFSHDAMTCTVYCHGSTLAGGQIPAPGWTDGAEVSACTSCHGNPPPPPHPVVDSCGGCHERPAATAHIDGILQLTIRGAQP